MSEVEPAVVRVPDPEDRIISGWERVYKTLKEKLFDCTEQVIYSMAEFQKELIKYLDEMTELNSEITRQNAELAMNLSDFERDVCHIRDYYDRIIASTKTVVNYGSNQKVIPYIRDLIDEKRYLEAKAEISSFLHYLKKLIERVELDINKMQEAKDCPDLETVRCQIREKISANDPTKPKQDQLQMNQFKVFRLGTSTLFYMLAGATAGVVVASRMPQESERLTEVVTSAGSEVLSFCTGNVLKGLGSVMEAAQLTSELKKRTESSIVKVCRCLTGFFKQLNDFQTDITTIENTIDGLKLDMDELKEEVDSGNVCTTAVSRWAYMKEILQKMFESFTCLSTRVIERSNEGITKESFDAAMERLDRSVELVTLGTPV